MRYAGASLQHVQAEKVQTWSQDLGLASQPHPFSTGLDYRYYYYDKKYTLSS